MTSRQTAIGWFGLAAAFMAWLTLSADGAHAGAIATTLCTVVSWFTGQIGRALATLAIIVVGVGATLGKVSWALAITVAVGISVMLGAPGIVFALTGAAGC